MLRFSTRTLLAVVAIVAFAIAIGGPLVRQMLRPRDTTALVSYATRGEYPCVHGVTFTDAADDPRIIVLHRQTRQLDGGFEPFDWLDWSITSHANGPQRVLTCKINGTDVWFADDVQVYYAEDASEPKHAVIPEFAVSTYEFPSTTWRRLMHALDAAEPDD